MPAKVLQTTFKADGDLLDYMRKSGAGADTLRSKMAELKAAAAAKAGGGDEKSALQNLKEQLGTRSSLGQLGRIAAGGGAIGGLTLITKALGESAEKAADLKRQFDAGKISAGGLAAGIAESLPVVGQFWAAGQQIRGLLATFPSLTDSWAGRLIHLKDAASVEEITKQEVARKALLDYQADVLERQKKTITEMATLSRKAGREQAGAGLEGYDRERFERQAANDEKLDDLKAKRQEALDASAKDRNAKNAEIGKQDIDSTLKVEMQTRLAKSAKDEQARINREFDEAEKAHHAAAAADGQAENQKHLQAMARLYAANAKETSDTLARADVERLKVSGDTLGAELLQVKQNAADKKLAIDKGLEEQLKQAGNPLDRQSLRDEAAAAKSAVDRAAGMERANAVYREMRDSQVQVLQAQAAGGNEAAAAELKRLEAARQYEDEAKKIRAVINDQGVAVEERAQAEKNLADLTAAQTARVAKDVRDQHLAALQQRSEYAATFAERKSALKELAGEQIKHEFEQRQAAAQAVQNDKNATAEQKRQAAADLASFAEQSGREFDAKVYGHRERIKNSFSAEENLGGLTGVAASARTRRDPADDIVKASKEGNRLTADLLTAAHGILGALTGGQPTVKRPIFDR